MNFSGLIVGSRFRGFMDVIDMFLEYHEVGEMDRETMLDAIHVTWGDRMKEWGWDIQELLTLLTEFE